MLSFDFSVLLLLWLLFIVSLFSKEMFRMLYLPGADRRDSFPRGWRAETGHGAGSHKLPLGYR